VYARRVGERELTFDFAEGLFKDNLLVVDRETGSLWSQLDSAAISGPLAGTPLEVVPSLQTTWKHWRTLHPESRVLRDEGKKGRPYLYRNRRPGGSRPRSRPTTHDTSALGLGLAVSGQAMFFRLSELARATTPFQITVGGESVQIHHHAGGMTAWAEDGDGRLLPAVLAYEYGWKDFFPDTRVYVAASSD